MCLRNHFEKPANFSITVDCAPEPSRVVDSTAIDSLAAPIDTQPDANDVGI